MPPSGEFSTALFKSHFFVQNNLGKTNSLGVFMKYIFVLMSVFLVACAGTGAIQQGNENAVNVLDHAGNYGDSGASLAATHCAKYGKVAVYEGETGSLFAARISYLCK